MHSEFTKYLIAFLFVSLVGQLAGAQQVPASPAIELSVAGQTDNIYNGEQLAAALRSAYAKGLGQQAQQAVATAVIYRITEGKGDQGTILVADAEKSLLSTGDALIANATDQAFGAAIQSVFTDPSITVTASDVAPAVETALLRGGGIASAAVSGMAGVTSTYCPQVADVLSQAKILAVNSGNGQAFDEAINTWSKIASTDSSSPASKLFACAPVTPGGSSSAGRK